MVGVDCSIIMNPKVWEASGHVGGFQDPMIVCKQEGCKRLFRADQVLFMDLKPLPDGASIESLDQDQLSKLHTVKTVSTATVEAGNFSDALAKHLKSKHHAKLESVQHKVLAGVAIHCDFAITNRGTFLCLERPIEQWSSAQCPMCQTVGTLTEPREFNLMFETFAFVLSLRDESDP